MTKELKPCDSAKAVPLVELLESVPADVRLMVDSEDGNETRFIPVGRYCQEAAAILRRSPEPSAGDAEALRLATSAPAVDAEWVDEAMRLAHNWAQETYLKGLGKPHGSLERARAALRMHLEKK